MPLALAIAEPWQAALLASAVVALFLTSTSAVLALLSAGAIGAAVALLGGAVPP